jgi:protein-disulfide isomerase
MPRNNKTRKPKSKPAASKPSKLRYLVGPLVAAGLAGGLAAYYSPSLTTEQAAAQAALSSVDYSHIQDLPVGDADAPVTLIEYGSFTCSHCANFANDIYPRLEEDFIKTGKVRFILREVITQRPGLWATMVARCDNGSQHNAISKAIFADFKNWTKQSPEEITETFATIARSHDLTQPQIDACLEDEAQAEALVARSMALGSADGIKGTPTLIINGELHRNMPYDDLAELLEQKVSQAE